MLRAKSSIGLTNVSGLQSVATPMTSNETSAYSTKNSGIRVSDQSEIQVRVPESNNSALTTTSSNQVLFG